MKSLIILFAFFVLASNAFAVCSSPISRTNFSANTVLTSVKLNADLNALYTQVNELPGDCLEDETVTSAKIDDGTIVAVDIANATITNSKLAALNYGISSDCGTAALTGTTDYADVTNLSVTITTSGRPVEAYLVSKAGETSNVQILGAAGTGVATGAFKLLRDATSVGELALSYTGTAMTNPVMTLPSSTIRFMDFPAAGTYTYKLQEKVTDVAYTISCFQARLVVREL